ncbi:hypothetical protein, variant [Fonticula alba]|nr:hypothetical protein, variant [Fonticula alba]KCV71453.1 hypothetical protein, variant [Fonticula alba]|eukprot:XP_009494575.1 hypothetical protein, variant [Fonticula alba]
MLVPMCAGDPAAQDAAMSFDTSQPSGLSQSSSQAAFGLGDPGSGPDGSLSTQGSASPGGSRGLPASLAGRDLVRLALEHLDFLDPCHLTGLLPAATGAANAFARLTHACRLPPILRLTSGPGSPIVYFVRQVGVLTPTSMSASGSAGCQVYFSQPYRLCIVDSPVPFCGCTHFRAGVQQGTIPTCPHILAIRIALDSPSARETLIHSLRLSPCSSTAPGDDARTGVEMAQLTALLASSQHVSILSLAPVGEDPPGPPSTRRATPCLVSCPSTGRIPASLVPF